MDTPTLLSRWQLQSHHLLGLLRLITAFLFIQFGTAKLLALPGPVMPDGGTAQLMSQAGVCFLFLYFSAAGPGAFAVSSLIRHRRGTKVGFGGYEEPLHSR